MFMVSAQRLINRFVKQLFLLVIFITIPLKIQCDGFGGFSIGKQLFNYVRSILPDGKTMLELGSGWASGEFSKHYTVYSIEDNLRWLNKYKTNYIHVPIKSNWYNADILKNKLPDHYDLILVDGPLGLIGRQGFCTYLHLFKINVPIIFDDTHREEDYKLCMDVARKLGKEVQIIQDPPKSFGVILP